MSEFGIDLSKKEEIKIALARAIRATSANPVFAEIYREYNVEEFSKEVSQFFDNPNNDGLQRVKVRAAQIYWQIVFTIMEQEMHVYADDFEQIEEKQSVIDLTVNKLEKIEFVFNYTASIFYSFASLHISTISVKEKRTVRLFKI